MTTYYDRATRRIIGWCSSINGLSQYELGRPLHFSLGYWCSDHEIQLVHGGLVSRNGEGVLLAGAGGSGKSTASLMCLSAGFDYLGDDYIGVLAGSDSTLLGHSIYNSSHLDPEHARRFPELWRHAIPATQPFEDKSLILLSDVFPESLGRSARIRALLLPRVADADESGVRAASKGDALLRLAPSTLLLLPGQSRRGLDFMARLVKAVPCFWLDLGRNLESIAPRVDEVLAGVLGR
jgi:hypothetical protein